MAEALDTFLVFVMRPFVGWALLATLIGQFMKAWVWTRERAEKCSPRWLWAWARRTMPFHPVAAGLGIGLLWPGPIEGTYTGGTLSGALYFAVAGMVSVWTFEFLKGLAKKYYGIELTPPGSSDPPKS